MAYRVCRPALVPGRRQSGVGASPVAGRDCQRAEQGCRLASDCLHQAMGNGAGGPLRDGLLERSGVEDFARGEGSEVGVR